MERKYDLCDRTKAFALRVIRLYTALPKSGEAQVIGKQLLRSGTSVGAQYREATRARSVAEFVSKIQAALRELEEPSYWFELLTDSEIVSARKLSDLMKECNEITAILVSSVKTAKGRKQE
jgi:four helix bundle protein